VKPALPHEINDFSSLTGSEPDPAAKPAIPLSGSLADGCQSLWVAWQPVIVAAMETGRSAIWGMLPE
jgi:hypothetical protein